MIDNETLGKLCDNLLADIAKLCLAAGQLQQDTAVALRDHGLSLDRHRREHASDESTIITPLLKDVTSLLLRTDSLSCRVGAQEISIHGAFERLIAIEKRLKMV